MDSQSKSDLIFYGGLALVILLLWKKSQSSTALTWQVDPATGNLVPAGAAGSSGSGQALLTSEIVTATSQPLVDSSIVNASGAGSGSGSGSAITWSIDPATGTLKPTATGPGTWGGTSGSW